MKPDQNSPNIFCTWKVLKSYPSNLVPHDCWASTIPWIYSRINLYCHQLRSTMYVLCGLNSGYNSFSNRNVVPSYNQAMNALLVSWISIQTIFLRKQLIINTHKYTHTSHPAQPTQQKIEEKKVATWLIVALACIRPLVPFKGCFELLTFTVWFCPLFSNPVVG